MQIVSYHLRTAELTNASVGIRELVVFLLLLLDDGRNLDLRSCAVDDVLELVLTEALSDWRDCERFDVSFWLEALSIAAAVRRVAPALRAAEENMASYGVRRCLF